jgi:hypothetical protein
MMQLTNLVPARSKAGFTIFLAKNNKMRLEILGNIDGKSEKDGSIAGKRKAPGKLTSGIGSLTKLEIHTDKPPEELAQKLTKKANVPAREDVNIGGPAFLNWGERERQVLARR